MGYILLLYACHRGIIDITKPFKTYIYRIQNVKFHASLELWKFNLCVCQKYLHRFVLHITLTGSQRLHRKSGQYFPEYIFSQRVLCTFYDLRWLVTYIGSFDLSFSTLQSLIWWSENSIQYYLPYLQGFYDPGRKYTSNSVSYITHSFSLRSFHKIENCMC